MVEYSSAFGAPRTLSIFEQAQEPAVVYWMPSRSKRAATYAEFAAVERAIEGGAFTEPNWDGYNALGVKAETKENAIRGINNILLEAPPPEMTPNPNGTLSFEWETQNGAAHLEVGQTTFSFYIRPRVGVPILFGGPADLIGRLHGSLMAGLLFPPEEGASATTPIRYAIDV